MTEALIDAGVEYPTSDGRPVAETPLHYRRLEEAWHALDMRFGSQPDVYVGANMLVYDEPGNPARHLSPDLFVAFGVEDRERDIYKLWEDAAPSFVLEITSKTTSDEDERKKARYARWGVEEYFLYDPRAEYVKPPLQGFRLSRGAYRAIATEILPNGKPGFLSDALGLGLWLDGAVLRIYDPGTSQNLSTPREAEAKAAAAEARAAAAEARAVAAETRQRRLEAELAELRNR
ncbi:MAG: Uma2 family endonuclease [Gammaproteobacteria bacterium]|nr:Uma2 family endonuclease [Gammaproteobacteria bacterium]